MVIRKPIGSFNALPRLIRFLILSISFNLLLFTLMRLVFFSVFDNPNDLIPSDVLIKSFYVGFKFDLRLALLLNLPVFLLGWIKWINIFDSRWGRRLWSIYLIATYTIVLIFYFTDFGFYAYLQLGRVDGTILRFLLDPIISLQMVWESYRVSWFLILSVLLIVFYWFLIRRMIGWLGYAEKTSLIQWRRRLSLSVCIVLYLFGLYGKMSYYPLRWSDAFTSSYSFASIVSLNPVLYFFETLKNRNVNYETSRVTEYYDVMADYLGVDHADKEAFNYVRVKKSREEEPQRPNVIAIFLESFAYYKTGHSGNPLSPTPNFDAMAKDAILFTRFYTPHDGTARSVYAFLTGIPDIESQKTSSRNPLVVNQHTIINAFDEHEKYYFIGGSASWGNIRGLLKNNIPGLHIYEEGSFTSPRIDVWGISDLHLLEEANKVLREQKDTPFFAIIQTSGNHKPYTIPEDNRGFQPVFPEEEQVIKYGFRSVDAYNAFRFMDHSLKIFLDAAQQEDYFQNTVFVLFGDHGLVRTAEHMSKAENQLGLTDYHVPLLIYAPGLIKEGKIIDKVASEVDVLPTIAGLTGSHYVNATLGRDLLDERYDINRYAFTVVHRQVQEIGLLGDGFYLTELVDGTNKRLHRLNSDTPRENVMEHYPDIFAKMERLCFGIYETAKYMRFHNSPESVIAKVK